MFHAARKLAPRFILWMDCRANAVGSLQQKAVDLRD